MMPSMSTRVVSPTLAGRQVEIDRLRTALERAIAGSSSIVLVAGEAGVGKTRLVTEIAALAREQGVLVLLGGSTGLSDSELPYGPFAEAFQGLLQAIGRERFLEAAGSGSDDVAWLVPEAADRRSLERGPLEEGAEARARLFGSVHGLLARVSSETPVLLVIEDLQWADPSSRSLLLSIVRRLPGTRVALVGTFRSDDLGRRHPLLPTLALLERLPSVERIDLPRLAPAAVQEQIAGILGAVPSGRLVDQIVERSDGNPFFVEELMAGGPDLGRPGVPPTIQDVIEVRLTALPEATQRVVRIAAVVGRRAEHALLTELAQVPDDELVSAIRPAVDGHILVPVEGEGPPSYAFRHALVREVAYDDLLPTERASLHRLVAETLDDEAGLPVADARAAAKLAYHWNGAHDDRRALVASVRAAEAASRMYAHDEALDHYERAIRLSDRVQGAEDETGMDRASLLDAAAAAAAGTGNPRRAVALTERAIALDSDGVGQASAATWAERIDRLAWYRTELGDAVGAKRAIDEALRRIPPGADPVERARLLTTRASMLWALGAYDEIVQTAPTTLEAAQAAGDQAIYANALLGIGAALATSGQFEAAIRNLREARDRFIDAADPQSAIAVSQLGYTLFLAGRYDEAVELAGDELDRQAATGGTRRYAPYVLTNVVDSYADLGRWDEALRLCEAQLAETTDTRAAPWFQQGMAEILAMRGEVDRAAEIVQAAADAIRPGDAVIDRIWVLRTAVVVARAREDRGAVRESIAEALATTINPEHDAPLWWLLVAGLASEADASVAATAAGSEDELELARANGRRLADILDRIERAAGEPEEWPPSLRALLWRAAAERTRLEGRTDPAAWARAADAYEKQGVVYEAAECRLRLAAAIVAGGGSRDEVAMALGQAHETAIGLRAAPLRAAIEAFARRARIDLGGDERLDDGLGLGLTARELEVLALLAEGRTNRQIGEVLFISEKTASVHVSNILGKLGVSSRGAAAAMAVRLGMGEAVGGVPATAGVSSAASARPDGPSGRSA
jgi:DNA-binding CsgD family transcriptional regulator